MKDHPFSTLIYEVLGGEDVLAEVVKVNPLSKLAVTSTCLLRSGVHILHLGIVMEPTDKVKPQDIKALQEWSVGEKGVGHDMLTD